MRIPLPGWSRRRRGSPSRTGVGAWLGADGLHACRRAPLSCSTALNLNRGGSDDPTSRHSALTGSGNAKSLRRDD